MIKVLIFILLISGQVFSKTTKPKFDPSQQFETIEALGTSGGISYTVKVETQDENDEVRKYQIVVNEEETSRPIVTSFKKTKCFVAHTKKNGVLVSCLVSQNSFIVPVSCSGASESFYIQEGLKEKVPKFLRFKASCYASKPG